MFSSPQENQILSRVSQFRKIQSCPGVPIPGIPTPRSRPAPGPSGIAPDLIPNLLPPRGFSTCSIPVPGRDLDGPFPVPGPLPGVPVPSSPIQRSSRARSSHRDRAPCPSPSPAALWTPGKFPIFCRRRFPELHFLLRLVPAFPGPHSRGFRDLGIWGFRDSGWWQFLILLGDTGQG